ncbi:MAG TPA: hypothetical protein VFH31_09710 [Pyrinomonadaceae bacterium]|nr:hypothetical protein [Pyrinomonadaceae bacterium]
MSYSFLSGYQPPDFRIGAVRPFQCLSSGWQIIKGQYFLFAAMCLIILVLVTLVPLTGLIWGAWMCGIYAALFARMRGETASFNAIGQGFQHFGPAFGVAVLNNLPFVPVLVAGILLESWMDEMDRAYPADEMPPEVFLQMLAYLGAVVLLFIVCTLVTGVIFAFAYQLVIDKKMSGWEATKLSARAARENFGGVVGLVFLELVLSAAGLLFCCFGLVLVMPLTKAAWAIAYAEVFPMALPPPPAEQPPPPPPVF